jgi:elongation factor Ts
MSTITAEQVSSLRKRTGVGMLAVKKALEESNGDEEQAIDLLRKRGEAQAVKKGEREQKEGCVFIASGSGKAALISLSCETDFVSRGEGFQKIGQEFAGIALEKGEEALKSEAETRTPEIVNTFGENISLGDVKVIEGAIVGNYVHSNNKIGVIISLEGGDEDKAKNVAMHAAAMAPTVVSPDEVSTDLVEKEKEIWKEQLSTEGKPEEIQEKIMIGKEKKFREESALIKQAFVKDPSVTIEQYLEGAKVVEYVRMAV